jgi:HEAT repeat protein
MSHLLIAACAGRGSRLYPAIPAVEVLLKDDDKDVRAAAAEALQKIRGEEPSK